MEGGAEGDEGEKVDPHLHQAAFVCSRARGAGRRSARPRFPNTVTSPTGTPVTTPRGADAPDAAPQGTHHRAHRRPSFSPRSPDTASSEAQFRAHTPHRPIPAGAAPVPAAPTGRRHSVFKWLSRCRARRPTDTGHDSTPGISAASARSRSTTPHSLWTPDTGRPTRPARPRFGTCLPQRPAQGTATGAWFRAIKITFSTTTMNSTDAAHAAESSGWLYRSHST